MTELGSKIEKKNINPVESVGKASDIKRRDGERARKAEANKCLNGLLKHFRADKIEHVSEAHTHNSKSHHLSLKDLRHSESSRLVKSVNHLLDKENSKKSLVAQDSIEIIFISDEFINKAQEQNVTVVDQKDEIERENSTKKKKFVVWANESKKHKKSKQEKTLNCFLSIDEPFDNLDQEIKSINLQNL